MALVICSNYHVRDTLDGFQAGRELREEFDYIDWEAVDRGEESAELVQYRGSWYDLRDVQVATDELKRRGFDGMVTDSFWSGVAFRYFDADGYPYEDGVVMARFYVSD